MRLDTGGQWWAFDRLPVLALKLNIDISRPVCGPYADVRNRCCLCAAVDDNDVEPILCAGLRFGRGRSKGGRHVNRLAEVNP